MPSGLNVTLPTRSVSFEGAGFLSRLGVPQLHRPVQTCRGEPLAVGAKGRAVIAAPCPFSVVWPESIFRCQ